MSCKKESKGNINIKVRVAVVDKKTGEESQVYENTHDGGTVQLSQLMVANILATAIADGSNGVKDTSGTRHALSANQAASAITVVAGTAGTTAAVTDYVLGSQSAGGQGSQAGTVGQPNITTDVFTVTANMAAPTSTILYKEIGITVTVATFVFLIARDYNGSGWSVDTSHYLAVTYTVTTS